MSFFAPKKPMPLCSLISSETGKAAACGILLTGQTMKSFLERLAARDELPSASSGPELVEGGRVGGRRSFRDLGMGETAALSLSKGMLSPASLKRDVNKTLKKQAREPWNERKGFMACAHFNSECFAE
jgi:hypothetical protein